MLKHKGVGDFVAAARELRRRGVAAQFVLVGDVDPGNPASFTAAELAQLAREGAVEWWGQREDMEKIFAAAHLVCLPSFYREGVPKVLLEAAAAGRAIITTDMPGCREIVHDGVNGLLVPIKAPLALAAAIEKLLADEALRERMGQQGRAMVEAEFAADIINQQTLELYERVLRGGGEIILGSCPGKSQGKGRAILR